MENVFAGMQVCGYVGVAAAAAAVCAGVCVMCVSLRVTMPHSWSQCIPLVQNYSFLDMFFYSSEKFHIFSNW